MLSKWLIMKILFPKIFELDAFHFYGCNRSGIPHYRFVLGINSVQGDKRDSYPTGFALDMQLDSPNSSSISAIELQKF